MQVYFIMREISFSYHYKIIDNMKGNNGGIMDKSKLITFLTETITLFFFICGVAWSRYDPGIMWRTVESGHFVVYYPEGHEAFARRVISLSDEVYGDVTGYFDVKPRKAPVVLHPGTDRLNGFYAPFPNRISLFETPASNLRGFGSSLDDLMDLVYTHEYTHFTHITMRRGWYGALTRIFGEGLALSNALSPGWAIEGITTNLETRFTTGGRGRSPFFKSTLLSFARDGRLWSMSAAGSPPPYGPPPGRIYHAGFFMVEYLNRKYGHDAFAKLSRRQSAHPVVGTGSALRHITGISSRKFYRDYVKDINVVADSLSNEVESRNLPSGEVLYSENLDGCETHFWTNRNTIMALRKGYKKKNAFLEIDPSTGKILQTIPTGRIANETPVRALPDGRLLFGETFFHPLGDGDIDVSDLVAFDPESHRRTRLTRYAHIYSADISPDNRTYAAIRRNGMWMDLVLLDTDGSNIRPLVSKPGLYWQSPCWSPDGKTIAVAVKSGAQTDIALVDPDNGTVRTLFEADSHGDNDPAFSPDGRWLVFSSSRDGIWNIYAWNRENSRLFQLTSVFSAAHEPRVSPDGKTLSFLAKSLTLNEIRTMPFQPEYGLEIHVSEGGALALPDLLPIHSGEIHDSKGISLLQAYKPFIHTPYPGQDEKGTTAGMFFMGADPVYLNSYMGSVTYGPESNRFGYDVSLSNTSFWPTFFAHAYDKTLRGNTPGKKNDHWYREQGAEIALDMDVIHRTSPSEILSNTTLGIRARRFKNVNDSKIIPAFDLSSSLFGSLSIMRIPDAAPRDMVPAWGQFLLAYREEELPQLGSEFPGHNQIIVARHYLPSLFRHHGFEFSLYHQHQGGMLHHSNYGVLPRGYSDDDKEGGFNQRKTLSMSLEYRFPLIFLDSGIGINLVHFNLLRGSLFIDHGAGWKDSFDVYDWGRKARTSVGTTLSVKTHIFSFVPFEIGAAFGYKIREDERFISLIMGLPIPEGIIGNPFRRNPCLKMLHRRFFGDTVPRTAGSFY